MELSLQQRALAYAGFHGDREALTSYKKTPESGSTKTLNKLLKPEEFPAVLAQYKKDPTSFSAFCRFNIFNLQKDKQLSPEEKRERLERYIDNYFTLICKIDAEAYKHNTTNIYNYVPTYLPDGLSDMGSDHNTSDSQRTGREKISIEKRKILEQARDLFIKIFEEGISKKKDIVIEVANWVHKNLPYDHKNRADQLGRGSIRIHKLHDAPEAIAVCRHHAIYTQVLNQTLGITSRLLKCNLDGQAHSCNLVRIDNVWYLLDVTNHIKITGKEYICLVPIEEKEIDLNTNEYHWEVASGKRTRTYDSRNNMYFRIK